MYCTLAAELSKDWSKIYPLETAPNFLIGTLALESNNYSDQRHESPAIIDNLTRVSQICKSSVSCLCRCRAPKMYMLIRNKYVSMSLSKLLESIATTELGFLVFGSLSFFCRLLHLLLLCAANRLSTILPNDLENSICVVNGSMSFPRRSPN